MYYVVKKKKRRKDHPAMRHESICQQIVQVLKVMHVINQMNPVISKMYES